MDEFEAAIGKAIDDGTGAGVAAIAVDKNGNTVYSKSFGLTSADPGAGPMQMDSVVSIASMTKLLTSVSALQCVERGLLSLDEHISTALPEFKSPQILKSFDADDQPTYTAAPTLRHLLTHSSSLGYTGIDPLLMKYWAQKGNPPDTINTTIAKSYTLPLVFEPGQGWTYGAGIDWAGQMVERVNGGVKLDPDIFKRICGKAWRNAETGILEPDKTAMFPIDVVPGDDYGANGIYTTAEDYIQVLKSLIMNDGKLLKPKTRDLLFTPCLKPKAKEALRAVLRGPFAAFLAPGYPAAGGDEGVEYEYALGGNVVVNKDGVKGTADQGMIYWAGALNSSWFIDEKRGVAGVYAAHVFPPGDKPTQDLCKLWHQAVYAQAG